MARTHGTSRLMLLAGAVSIVAALWSLPGPERARSGSGRALHLGLVDASVCEGECVATRFSHIVGAAERAHLDAPSIAAMRTFARRAHLACWLGGSSALLVLLSLVLRERSQLATTGAAFLGLSAAAVGIAAVIADPFHLHGLFGRSTLRLDFYLFEVGALVVFAAGLHLARRPGPAPHTPLPRAELLTR